MALTFTKVPDCAADLGPSQHETTWQVQPGTSDYPSSGYPITSAELGVGPLYGAWAINGNAASAPYELTFVQPSYPAIPAPQGSLFMEVSTGGTQVTPGTNLGTAIWTIRFLAESK